MIRSGNMAIGTLFLVTVSLALLGIIMILSASQEVLSNPERNIYGFMGKQVMWFSLGLIGMGFFAVTDFNRWERWARWLLLFNIILLALVLFTPLGNEVNGARRWLRLGMNLGQPSDLTKIAVIFYLAAIWAERQDLLSHFWRSVFFPLTFVGIALALILKQPDHGTVAFIGVVAMVMWFTAGGRLMHMVPVFLLFVVVVAVALYHKPALFQRIDAFLNPEAYSMGKGFQIRQAMIGFAHGGMWGVGFGDGLQQMGFTPEAHTDFIFSVMGEELGFVKCSLVILAYLLIVCIGYTTAIRCENPFGRLLAVGCTTAIGVQAALNIAVVTGSVPTTGIALPFLSFGGSALLINMSMVGLLMSVAKETFDTGWFDDV